MQLNDRREAREQPKARARAGCAAGGQRASRSRCPWAALRRCSPALPSPLCSYLHCTLTALQPFQTRPLDLPTRNPQVDADFFNAFEDAADESDMRPQAPQ